MSNAVEIPLTLGKVALIDAADHALVSQFKWTAMKIYGRKREMWYARRNIKRKGQKQKTILLHRFLMNVTERTQLVDHRDGNGLDCRRKNLRLATNSENRTNAHQCRALSGFRGVTRIPANPHRPYHARIYWKGTKYLLGHFATAEEAARAYDAKAKELHGAFATLNFSS